MNTPNGLEALTRINTDDMLEALGLEKLAWCRPLLERLCFPAARRFARQVESFDRMVGASGLGAGARWLLDLHVSSLAVAGRETVPAEGPLLIVSNHPGLVDTISLFATLPRPDLKVVVADRPFLRELRNTSSYLIFLRPDGKERTRALRDAVSHMRRGGAVLTYPGGRIEPDPDLSSAAVASLERWSKSIGAIVRLAPEARIVAAVVSGVVSASAQSNPLTRLRRKQEDRDRFAAMLQVAIPVYRNVKVRVAFGPPIPAAELLATNGSALAITEKVVQYVRQVIESPPSRWQVILK